MRDRSADCPTMPCHSRFFSLWCDQRKFIVVFVREFCGCVLVVYENVLAFEHSEASSREQLQSATF